MIRYECDRCGVPRGRVIGEPVVAAHARQVHADRTRCQLVEDAEGFFRHLEGALGFVKGAEALHVR